MELTKNDKIELNIDALTSEGSGVGRYNGLAVFVNDTVPGDKIIAHIIKRSKNYAVGKVDKILSPSTSRIESDCPYSQRCGGCSFRNMTYDEELKYKLSRVNDSLERIGHLDIKAEEIIGAKSVDYYRNKAQYPVSVCDGELFAGFYAYKSHRIISCSDCRLQPKDFEQGIKAFEKWVEKAGVTSYDENHICFALIYIDNNGFQIRQIFFQQFNKQIRFWNTVTVNYCTSHKLISSKALAEINMP